MNIKGSRPKRSKAPDRRPARARYWVSGRLAVKKVRALVRSGYTVMAALDVWEKTRKRNKGQVNIRDIQRLQSFERKRLILQ